MALLCEIQKNSIEEAGLEGATSREIDLLGEHERCVLDGLDHLGLDLGCEALGGREQELLASVRFTVSQAWQQSEP